MSMSAARKQIRNMRRKLAMKGITDDTAQKIIDAANYRTEKVKSEIAEDVIEQMRKKYEPEIRYKAMADIILLMCGYLHIDCGYGKIRLVKFLREFCEFADAVAEEGGQSDLRQILIDECKFDLVKEFAKCAKIG